MTAPESDWIAPDCLRPLTSPELYVLLHGSCPGNPVVKLALQELLFRGILAHTSVERTRFLGRKSTRHFLNPGPNFGADLSPSLAAVRDVFRVIEAAEKKRTPQGVPLEEFAQQAFLKYSVSGHVFPTLVGLGLYRTERRKFLGLIPHERYALTGSGGEAKAALAESLAAGNRELHGWIGTTPARAAAFVAMAGVGVLLLDKPVAQEVFRNLRTLGGGDAWVWFGGDTDWGDGFDSIDGVSDMMGAFDSIDSSVDSSSDGGDSGGGGDGGD